MADAANQVMSSLANEDYDAACDLMTTDMKQEFVVAGAFLGGGGDCAKSVEAAMGMIDNADREDLKDAQVTAEDVSINGDVATVRDPGLDGETDTSTFRKKGGEWLLDSGEGN